MGGGLQVLAIALHPATGVLEGVVPYHTTMSTVLERSMVDRELMSPGMIFTLGGSRVVPHT